MDDISSVIAVIIVIAGIIGKVLKSRPESQAKAGSSGVRHEGQPGTPYAQSPSKQVEEKRTGWLNAEPFRELIEKLEIGVTPAPIQPEGESAGFREAFEGLAPIDPPPEESWKRMLPPEGHSEGAIEAEGEPAPEVVVRVTPAAPAQRYFASGGELRRAVVMSEVLGKPVSLRSRGARPMPEAPHASA